MGRLDGRVALVTGGSGGIGHASVLELAKDGASVSVQYNRGKSAAESTVAEVRKLGPRAIAVQADVSDPDACEGLVEETRNAFGRLDIAACFAGHPFRSEAWYKEYAALTPSEIRAPIDIDLLGSIFVTQAALPTMVQARRGSVILVGSTPALTGDTVGIPYLVAKGGILALARALAQVYGPRGVRVNARCDAGELPKRSRASSRSSPRMTRRTSPAKRLSSMADSRSADPFTESE